MGPKKKRARRTAREMFKQTKRKRSFPNFNAVLDESVSPSSSSLLFSLSLYFLFSSLLSSIFVNIFQKGLEAFPANIPNYFSAAAAPSKFPAKNFCSVCGYPFRLFSYLLLLLSYVCLLFFFDFMNIFCKLFMHAMWVEVL